MTSSEIKIFSNIAADLGLEVLLEVHEKEQLDKWNPAIHLVGVNNRNLKTFEVSVQHSFDVLPLMPVEAIKIAESGEVGSFEGEPDFVVKKSFVTMEDPCPCGSGKKLGECHMKKQ